MIKKLALTAIASLSLVASVSQAQVFGSICRTGMYYSVVAPMPVGASCWNHAWNMPGMVSTW